MFFSDNAGRAVARFIRPNPWFLQKMEITAAGATIGYILQKRDNKNPIFHLCDAEKTVVLEIKGPACMI